MLMSGQKISGRYEIKKVIGQGGMADVYLAWDTILERDVAIKVLRANLREDERFIRRFQREAMSSSSLSHPNIVNMYDVGEDADQHYIVMEYLNGPTLKSMIKKRGCLSLVETIDIMKQLTSGIGEAHKMQIVHRDLKPQNILILDDGTVKVTDFGIAIAMNQTALTQTNSVMGSVHYLSPEQASGKQSTTQTDIYSLGIVMYEMLTGEVPFMGESPVSVALKHMRQDLPSLREKNPEIPQSVDNIIIKATAKNPSNRYVDANAMFEDLETCLEESRANEEKITFDYIENEIDQTKILPTLGNRDRSRIRNSVASEHEVEEVENKSIFGRAITVLLTILTFSLLILLFSVLIIPATQKVPEVEIPDVSGKNLYEAEQTLINTGLDVSLAPVEVYSETVDKGIVVKTVPNMGRVVKEDSEVTIYISLGSEKITLDDYTGQNVNLIRGKLEALGLEVEIISESFSEDLDENIIVSQDPQPETKLEEGEQVILVIPKIVETYPDFVRQNPPISEIQSFATKHGLILNIRYVYSDTYRIDDIVSQNRAYGDPIIKGATLTIEVSLGTEE